MPDKPGKSITWSCPLPRPAGDKVLLAHGGGGRLMQELIESLVLPSFSSDQLAGRHDGAVVEVNGQRLAMTTDSYIVRPLIFPGGNIGELAVNGTINDLAMCGARPLYLSCGLILEEGLPMETLRTIIQTMAAAARRAGVSFITGDTKVVDKGKGDGVFINTAGIGLVETASPISPSAVMPGDAVVVSGDVGAHGVAILSVREGLEFEAPVVSDTAPLWEPVEALLAGGIAVHCLRDVTRGGLSSVFNEIAAARGVGIQIEEAAVPVAEAVRGACELLGLDPFHIACEGCFVAFVPEDQADRAVEILRQCEPCQQATRIGTVANEQPGTVVLRSSIGGSRILDMLSGEQLPRIC